MTERCQLSNFCFQVQLDFQVFILSLGRIVTVLIIMNITRQCAIFALYSGLTCKINNFISFFRSVTNSECTAKVIYRLDGQVCLEVGGVDPLFINFGVVNLLFIHKMVDNTRFKTNLTVQAVCSIRWIN